jgi:hypothetical protein
VASIDLNVKIETIQKILKSKNWSKTGRLVIGAAHEKRNVFFFQFSLLDE